VSEVCVFVPALKSNLRVLVVQGGSTPARNLNKSRPDLVLGSLFQRIENANIFVASTDLEDSMAYALAICKCLPPFDMKIGAASRKPNHADVHFLCAQADAAFAERMNIMSSSIQLTQLLVDAPPCYLETESFEGIVREQTKGIQGVKMTVIRGAELRERGMGGLYGVGKAAAKEPRMIILSHGGSDKNGTTARKSVCLVGKGIVYDTGGLALKSKEGMCGMKVDMGGAAGVFGSFLAVAKMGGLESGIPFHVPPFLTPSPSSFCPSSSSPTSFCTHTLICTLPPLPPSLHSVVRSVPCRKRD
jgi:probable aminopeptidase NPEPL1